MGKVQSNQMWRSVIKDWELLATVVSDRDAKFTGEFWRQLMIFCKVQLRVTTANHPAANGQAERTNATVECIESVSSVLYTASILFSTCGYKCCSA